MNPFKISLIMIRRFIYLTLGFIDNVLNRRNPLVILCYHSLANDNWRFSVGLREFEKQILHMLTSYKPITLKDVYNHLKGKKGKKNIVEPSFVITFDDGYKDILKIKKLLENLEIRPTVFVLSAKEANVKSLGTNRPLLSQKDLKSLRNLGWEIGYHGKTHNILTEMKKDLKEEILSQYKYFAYPKGKYSKRIISQLIKMNYKLAVTMNDSIISSKTNAYEIPRIGVDRTHTYLEFQTLASPSVVKFRNLVKNSFLGKYL